MSQERRKADQRITIRRAEDRARQISLKERERKLNSLLELGQLIGLDLELHEMLIKIAQKASEVMDADRCSLFLHDSDTDELWSTVALGMEKEVIRFPSGIGIAGYCFQKGVLLNTEDVDTHPRFNKEVDAQTGYRTHSLLCVPLFKRDGERLGVIQLLNKRGGVFSDEDATFLKNFGNHASVFIEIAQLQQARIMALEESKRELEQLNKVKGKALDHLSHELGTPLSVIQANIRLLKRKTQSQTPPLVREEFYESLEKNLNRLFDIQHKTDQILQSHQELETTSHLKKLDTKESVSLKPIPLQPFTEQILKKVRQDSSHRDLQIQLDGTNDLTLNVNPNILEETLVGLLKNAIENTPNEGMIRIVLEQKARRIQIKVQDFGIGITEENQGHLFSGLFHTLDTELYASKKPYDFGAGGKGLDLLKMKVYSKRFGFSLSVVSQRCLHLPKESDLCPGRISLCKYCKNPEDCLSSGGSTFCLSFRSTK